MSDIVFLTVTGAVVFSMLVYFWITRPDIGSRYRRGRIGKTPEDLVYLTFASHDSDCGDGGGCD